MSTQTIPELAGISGRVIRPNDADRVRAAYPGKTWDRLRDIKRRYDPTNLLKICQSIPPATDG